LVCGGILILPRTDKNSGKFRVPYVNAKYIVPLILLVAVIIVQIQLPDFFRNFFGLVDVKQPNLAKMAVLHERIPYFAFTLLVLAITVLGFIKNYSLIPVLGLISCFYLMTELGTTNWLRFLIWLIIGLIVYFSYSYKNSKLGKETIV
jgi:ABC-type branched-subunit amino acid transport system permease subunit